MSLYNVVFTALTPLIVGTMDSDVNREMSRKYPGPPLTQRPLHHPVFFLKFIPAMIVTNLQSQMNKTITLQLLGSYKALQPVFL